MQNIFFIIFRRMRAPLLALILAYATAVLGMVLVPGQDAQGNPWHMDFFHAFYFISFMASTIGFGEIPYEFSDAQRLWVTFMIFTTVVVWIYAIGTLIALLQEPTFKQALVERRFARRIRQMRDHFYLVCGYGEAGRALIQSLTERNQHAVVIDKDQESIGLIRLENLRQFVPAMSADASLPLHLLEAGLKHPFCDGVVALTNSNEVNLKIAICAKLLHPDMRVVCRADSRDVEANMASIGTDYIIDPFETFAIHLATALHSPCVNLLQEWLSKVQREPLNDPVYPPRDGRWLLCGFGRFGKAVYERLTDEGLEVVVIENAPELTGAPHGRLVQGRGTEAETLLEAGVKEAVGLVAGTDDDTNNLSIIMTAKELNPKLFVVMRQNRQINDPIVQAVAADMVMHPSLIIANRIRVLLGTPMLYDFVRLILNQDDTWACQLVSRISALVNRHAPEIWEVSFTQDDTHAICLAVHRGAQVNISKLITDPRDRSRQLRCIPLMLVRQDRRILLPDPSLCIQRDDQLLFCGSPSSRNSMEWTLQNEHALSYILTGEARPQGWIWRWLRRREVV